jgi:hypothetical protein
VIPDTAIISCSGNTVSCVKLRLVYFEHNQQLMNLNVSPAGRDNISVECTCKPINSSTRRQLGQQAVSGFSLRGTDDEHFFSTPSQPTLGHHHRINQRPL